MSNITIRIITAATIAILLLVLLALRLSIGLAKAFFITGSIDLVGIFAILTWTFIRNNFLAKQRINIIELTTFVAFRAALSGVVTLACLHNSHITFYVAVSSAAAIGLFFASWVSVSKYFTWRKQLQENEELLEEDEEVELENTFFREVAGLPKRFRYLEIKAATNNFETRIGRGGSGSVFIGILDGLQIAVKRIEGEIRGKKEFLSEITAILSVQHVNLVRILGYCLVPHSYRFLVYEFFVNGSLDSWIFPENANSLKGRCMGWSLRYQVAIDVAKALAYLHHDCRVRILHLDVKPENILLDENFHARVTDFGISKLMERDESKVLTTVRGTRGYLAPEWFVGVGISEKCDVYSYGMDILELVGGRRNASFSHHVDVSERWSYYPKNVSQKMREGRLMEAVDERLLKDGSVIREEDVRTMVYVALWCIQEKPELRPSMDLVLRMLQGYVPVSMPPETKMFMVDLVLPVDNDTEVASIPSVSQIGSSSTYTESSQHHSLLSLNSISISS